VALFTENAAQPLLIKNVLRSIQVVQWYRSARKHYDSSTTELAFWASYRLVEVADHARQKIFDFAAQKFMHARSESAGLGSAPAVLLLGA
jgi:hypothetical protein